MRLKEILTEEIVNKSSVIAEVNASDLYPKAFEEFRAKYADKAKDPTLYVNFSDFAGNTLDKNFVSNPNHGDPVGLYAYPLEYVLNHPADIQYGQQAKHLRVIRDTSRNKLDLSSLNADKAVAILTKMGIEDASRRMTYVEKALSHRAGNLAAKAFFGVVQFYAQSGRRTFTPNATQTALFVKAGFDAIEDRSSTREHAIIHPNEPEQIVFLKRSAFEVVDVFELRHKREAGKIDYQSTTENFKRLPGLIAQMIGDRIVANNVGSDKKRAMSFYTAQKRKIVVTMEDNFNSTKAHRELSQSTPETVTIALMGPDFKTIRRVFDNEITFEAMAKEIAVAFSAREAGEGKEYTLAREFGPTLKATVDAIAAIAKKLRVPFTMPETEKGALRVWQVIQANENVVIFEKNKADTLERFEKIVARYFPGHKEPQGREMIAIWKAMASKKKFNNGDLYSIRAIKRKLGMSYEEVNPDGEDYRKDYGNVAFSRKGQFLYASLSGKEHKIAEIDNLTIKSWEVFDEDGDERALIPYADKLVDYLNELNFVTGGYHHEFLIKKFGIYFDGERFVVYDDRNSERYGEVRIDIVPMPDGKRSVIALVDGETDWSYLGPGMAGKVTKWRDAVPLFIIDQSDKITYVHQNIGHWLRNRGRKLESWESVIPHHYTKRDKPVWDAIMASGFDPKDFVKKNGFGFSVSAGVEAADFGYKINLDTGKVGKTFLDVAERVGIFNDIEILSLKYERDQWSPKLRYFLFRQEDGKPKQALATELDAFKASDNVAVHTIPEDLTVEERNATKQLIAHLGLKVPKKFTKALSTRK